MHSFIQFFPLLLLFLLLLVLEASEHRMRMIFLHSVISAAFLYTHFFHFIFLASSFRLKYLCRFSFFKKNIHTDIIYLHWMCVCALYVCFFSTCCCCLAMIWGKHLIVRIILARRMKKCVQIIVYKFLEVLAVVEMAAATAIATLTVAVPI